MAESPSTPKRAAKAPADGKPPSRSARPSGMRAAARAARQLADLTGRELEGIVGLADDDDDGWIVQVEVVELRRVPNTTDVLAVYEVALDRSGDLMSYRRVDRYVRGAAGEDRR